MARHKLQKCLIAFYDTYLILKLFCIFMIHNLFAFHHVRQIFKVLHIFLQSIFTLKTLPYFHNRFNFFRTYDICFYNTFILFMIPLHFEDLLFFKTSHNFPSFLLSVMFHFFGLLFNILLNFPHTFFFCTYLVLKARVITKLSPPDRPSPLEKAICQSRNLMVKVWKVHTLTKRLRAFLESIRTSK